MVSLYFHIPFCKKKCDYCHFYVIPDKESDKKDLFSGLQLEWQQRLPYLQDKRIVSIYFGGGTPYLFGPDRIAEIISWINPLPETEITLEANPEDVTLNGMTSYRTAGINRVSIGIQSLNDHQLLLLSRQHNAEKAKEAVWLTHEAGITKISIDLMYEIPKQTIESWETSLDEALKLPISHLSLYNLVIEPHTVFYKKRKQIILPDPETSLRMYELAIRKLTEKGLQQYEISAFGNPSIHNTGYWIGRPFLGFGPSAFSFWNEKRFRNISHLSRYLKMLKEGRPPIDFEEELPQDAKLRERLAINLRLLEGVKMSQLNLDSTTQQCIRNLIKEGFLKLLNNQLSLTKKGLLFYDTIATELI